MIAQGCSRQPARAPTVALVRSAICWPEAERSKASRWPGRRDSNAGPAGALAMASGCAYRLVSVGTKGGWAGGMPVNRFSTDTQVRPALRGPGPPKGATLRTSSL